MGYPALLLGTHLSIGERRSLRQEPGVPSKLTTSSRLKDDLAVDRTVRDDDIVFHRCRDDAASRRFARGDSADHGGEALTACSRDEPLDVGTGKTAEGVQLERDIFYGQRRGDFEARSFELGPGDFLEGATLDLGKVEIDAFDRGAEQELDFRGFVRVRGDESQGFRGIQPETRIPCRLAPSLSRNDCGAATGLRRRRRNSRIRS